MSVSAESFIVGTVGNLYELRRAGARGTAVIDFSVAVTPRVKTGDNWGPGETVWINSTAWGRLAENIAKSFSKGDRIIMQGRWSNKAGYTRDDGTQVPGRLQFVADFAGVDVFFDPARSLRQGRDNAPIQGGFDGASASYGNSPSSMGAGPNAYDDFNQPF